MEVCQMRGCGEEVLPRSTYALPGMPEKRFCSLECARKALHTIMIAKHPPAVCALAGCYNVVRPDQEHTVRGRDEKYCSHECAVRALELMTAKGRKGKMPHVPAEDFGNAGVIRRYCDRKSCGRPILLCWKTEENDNEYCSNTCLKLARKESTMPETTTATATETDVPAPIVAGKSATPKKNATKKSPKKAPAAPAPKKVVAKATTKATKPAPKTGKAPNTAVAESAVRPGSNMEILYKLVSKGLTLDKMVAATGWESEMVSRTLNNLRRKSIPVTRQEDGTYTLGK